MFPEAGLWSTLPKGGLGLNPCGQGWGSHRDNNPVFVPRCGGTWRVLDVTVSPE